MFINAYTIRLSEYKDHNRNMTPLCLHNHIQEINLSTVQLKARLIKYHSNKEISTEPRALKRKTKDINATQEGK